MNETVLLKLEQTPEKVYASYVLERKWQYWIYYLFLQYIDYTPCDCMRSVWSKYFFIFFTQNRDLVSRSYNTYLHNFSSNFIKVVILKALRLHASCGFYRLHASPSSPVASSLLASSCNWVNCVKIKVNANWSFQIFCKLLKQLICMRLVSKNLDNNLHQSCWKLSADHLITRPDRPLTAEECVQWTLNLSGTITRPPSLKPNWLSTGYQPSLVPFYCI